MCNQEKLFDWDGEFEKSFNKYAGKYTVEAFVSYELNGAIIKSPTTRLTYDFNFIA
jgi:hypothetical protein